MIAQDKKKHFFYGGVFALIVSLIASSNGHEFNSPLTGCLIGFTSGVVLGVLKELVYDWALGKGRLEFMDFAYTALGSFAFSALLYLILILS